MLRIAIIRFWYEGNAFSPAVARREDFMAREWLWGPAAQDFYTGQALETGACVDFLRVHADVRGEFVFCAAAYPAGPIESGLATEILARVEAGLAEHHWDGVYLSLHGSSVFEDVQGFETLLLERVRKQVGNIPLAASFDLHANLDPAIGQLADIVSGYKTYPHIDMRATGARAMDLLYRTLQGEIDPVAWILPAGFAPTSFNMRSDSGPMSDIIRAASAAASTQGLHDLTAFGGFIYADSPHTGAGVAVCAERAALPRAQQAAQRIVKLICERAPDFDIRLPDPRVVLSELAKTFARRRIAVLEPSDNPFSGGAGDTPGLLRAVLDLLPEVPSVFAFFHDPELAETAHLAGVGATLEWRFGARLTRRYGEPVQAKGVVEKLTSGEFRNRGPMERGLPVHLGRTALVRVAQVRIIITSRKVPVNDPGYFSLHGIDPQALGLIFVKAKNHFRAAFADHLDQILEVETPGPAQSDISTLKFKHVQPQRLRLSGSDIMEPFHRANGV